MNKSKVTDLENKARLLRRKTLDLSIKMGEAHLGGSLSCIEILTYLFDSHLNGDDIFVLSKGHSSFPYYISLQEKGFNPVISTHPEIDTKNGIYCTTGSLGHGLPIAAGMAFARKRKKLSGNIYVLMSDGECQEGTTWEVTPLVCYYRLDNLIVIIDNNRIQALDRVDDVAPVNIGGLFQSQGINVHEIDGHSFQEISGSLQRNDESNLPKFIIANTVKGKGISFIEDSPMWHTRLPNSEELEIAYEELK